MISVAVDSESTTTELIYYLIFTISAKLKNLEEDLHRKETR